VERDGRNQGQCRGWRVVRLHAHQGADVEVAGRGDPQPPLPPLAAGLAVGAEPQALGGTGRGAGEEVVVGGAGLGDRFDARQWPLGLA
jgi:hypothetical protein